MIRLTRRDVLRTLAAAPLSVAGACACPRKYPTASGQSIGSAPGVEPILKPMRPRPARVIDTHAHFFNASDVPLRGFMAECFGHKAPTWLQALIRAAAVLAEKFADLAPTAAEELRDLNALSRSAFGRSAVEIRSIVDNWLEAERGGAAGHLVEIIRGTDFERRYRELTRGFRREGPVTIEEVLRDVGAARRPRIDRPAAAQSAAEVRANTAKSMLEFLFYMLSKRACNITAYAEAFSPRQGFGIDMVLGSLVDFDYWLDCPPHSPHEDQIVLHRHLATLSGGYLQPLVGYNPWTDIEQGGAGLRRVCDAWATGVFVGAKIYPPTGFMPAANASTEVKTDKRRPDLQKLDDTLKTFFETCARDGIPVLAHTERKNGRDNAHDEFSSPAAWHRHLRTVAAEVQPIISFGHFGDDDLDTDWTRGFADLMKNHPRMKLFADLGYWELLMCGDANECEQARDRLRSVLATSIPTGETVADRVMFATDWLMLSQVSDWQAYPDRVRVALEDVAPNHVAKILGDNARQCFTRIPS